ncbi:hypothetical protein [Streptomyces sp. NPDC002172]
MVAGSAVAENGALGEWIGEGCGFAASLPPKWVLAGLAFDLWRPGQGNVRGAMAAVAASSHRGDAARPDSANGGSPLAVPTLGSGPPRPMRKLTVPDVVFCTDRNFSSSVTAGAMTPRYLADGGAAIPASLVEVEPTQPIYK